MRTFRTAAIVAVALAGASAEAAVVTRTYAVTATGFAADAPDAVVSLNFTLTFDPTLNYGDTTSGLTVDSIVPGYFNESGSGFAYDAGGTGKLTVGGLLTGVGQVTSRTNDYILLVSNAAGDSPVLDTVVYAKAGITPFFQATTGTIVVTPEPAALSLLAAAGMLLGRRRRA